MDCKYHPNCAKTASQCKFTHPLCPRFDKPNGCRYKASLCKFTHPSCNFFVRGECKKGDQCVFSHKKKINPPPYSEHAAKTHGSKRDSTVVASQKVVERTEREPFEMSFLIDVSSSMSGDAILHCKTALKDITSTMRPQDKIAIYTFSNTRKEVLPLQSKRSHGDSHIKSKINSITAYGGTALWDSIVASIETIRNQKLNSGDNKVVRKLFIFTDGADAHSRKTWEECASTVQRPGVTLEIFLVAAVASISSVSQKQLADLGGGKRQQFYKYKPIADVGDILEGFTFFKSKIFLEETVQRRQTKMVAKEVTTVEMVPRTTIKTKTRRTQIK